MHLTATGFIDAPDNPPTLLLSIGVAVSISIAIPPTVLIQLSASAPAASTALAIIVMFGTFGESLTMIGIFVFFFTSFVTLAASSGSEANGFPNSSSTFGQEMLTSIKLGLAFETSFAVFPKSSTLEPNMLAIIGSFVLFLRLLSLLVPVLCQDLITLQRL